MPTIGRPISLTTIIKRLRHLRDNAFYDTPDQHLLDDISGYLALEGDRCNVKHLRNMIIDLQAISDRAPTHLEDTDTKMLTSCIDGLARIETDRIGATKELKALSRAKASKAKHIAHVDAVLATVKPTKPDIAARKALAQSSTHAIADAIHVLVNLVADGRSDFDTFESIRSMVNVLENLQH